MENEKECLYCNYTSGIRADWDYDKSEENKFCQHELKCKKAKEKGLSLRYCTKCTGMSDDGLFCPNEDTCESREDNRKKYLSSIVNFVKPLGGITEYEKMGRAKELSDQAGARVDNFFAQQKEHNYNVCRNIMQQNAGFGRPF